MEATAFAGAARHVAEHQDFVAQVTAVQARFRAGEHMLLGLDLTEFLRAWLTTHILGTDRQLARHLNDNGIR